MSNLYVKYLGLEPILSIGSDLCSKKRRPFYGGKKRRFAPQNLDSFLTATKTQYTNVMDVDFVIPLSKDDLLSGEAGSYVVDEILSVRILPNKLRGRSIIVIKTETYKALNRHTIMKGHFLFSFQYHVITFSLPSRPPLRWTTSYCRKFRLLFQRFKVSI